MRSYVTIIDTERKKEEREFSKELPDLKKVFSLKEFKIKKVELVLDKYGRKCEKRYPIKEGKNTFYAIIKQLITTDDNKHFSRELQIRIDDTHHHGYDIHINLNLVDRYIESKKKEEINLGVFHHKNIKNGLYDMLFVCMTIPGRALGMPIVYFTNKEQSEYYEKLQRFRKRLREGKLSKKDELNLKKASESYGEILRKRERKKSSGIYER